jgi:prepilin-type N-terminal cleavage/methylation domain-containing protein
VAADQREDKGFTLVEILIAIVLVGILSAVVVVGISNLTSKGSSSACKASADAAKAGSVVYYSTNGYEYPTTFNDMTGVSPAALTLPEGVTVDSTGKIVSGDGWTLTLGGGGTTMPTFTCS